MFCVITVFNAPSADHPGERPMTFVRFCGGQRVPQFKDVCVDLAVHLPMPISLRVRLKPAVAVHGRGPVAGPKAAGATKRGYSALHRHAGAGHRHGVVAIDDHFGGPVDRFGEFRRLAYPGLIVHLFKLHVVKRRRRALQNYLRSPGTCRL